MITTMLFLATLPGVAPAETIEHTVALGVTSAEVQPLDLRGDVEDAARDPFRGYRCPSDPMLIPLQYVVVTDVFEDERGLAAVLRCVDGSTRVVREGSLLDFSTVDLIGARGLRVRREHSCYGFTEPAATRARVEWLVVPRVTPLDEDARGFVRHDVDGALRCLACREPPPASPLRASRRPVEIVLSLEP